MRATAAVLLGVIGVGLALPLAADARDPRLEHLALRPRDNALAKGAVANRTDLTSGWMRTQVARAETTNDCAGYSPDLSRFTITGRSASAFFVGSEQRYLESTVEIYETPSDARSNFALTTARAADRCFADEFRNFLESISSPSIVVTFARSHRSAVPGLGRRSVSLTLVYDLASAGTRRKYTVVLAIAQRGRGVAFLTTTNPGARPAPGWPSLVERMAARIAN